MLTMKMHVTPIDITGVAAANAQDQAEADALFSPTVLPDAPTADPYRRKLDLWGCTGSGTISGDPRAPERCITHYRNHGEGITPIPRYGS